MGEVPLRADPGEGHTKWRRLAYAISSNQAKTGNGNALVALVRESMRPELATDRKKEPMGVDADGGQPRRADLGRSDTIA